MCRVYIHTEHDNHGEQLSAMNSDAMNRAQTRTVGNAVPKVNDTMGKEDL